MNSLLERPAICVLPTTAHDRRFTFDRRHDVPTLIDRYRWLSAMSLKLMGAFLIVGVIAWRQMTPAHPLYHGALSGEAVYHWHGFHRVH